MLIKIQYFRSLGCYVIDMQWPLHCFINHQSKIGMLVFQFKEMIIYGVIWDVRRARSSTLQGHTFFECFTAFACVLSPLKDSVHIFQKMEWIFCIYRDIIGLYKVKSSASNLIWDVKFSLMSLILYRRNISGPNTVPCGTPDITLTKSDASNLLRHIAYVV